MDKDFLEKIIAAHQKCNDCPKTEEISSFFNQLLGLLFPNFSSHTIENTDVLASAFDQLESRFNQLIKSQPDHDASSVTASFFNEIPRLYDLLIKDIEAIYKGDPAATDKEEVVRCYPGFYAIAAYRFAHQLLQLNVHVIPRAITEYAHSKTGIDIHPAAEIGEYFCIDHGTGVVIGETTQIGNQVKVYQGVTLGALSVDKNLANVKRHPTIEDEVVIYSGATILGGETVIGKGATIGGNVWLTKSVPAGSKVYYQPKIDANGQQVSSGHTLIK